MRRMRHHRRVPYKKGLPLMFCLIHKNVDRVDRLSTDLEPHVAVALTFGHSLGEPTTLVISLPPFAGLKADITRLRQKPWQRRNLVHVSIHLLTALVKCGQFSKRIAL